MLKVGNKVRIKTEKEFIKEFGVDWRTISVYTYSRHMDKYLGKIVTISKITTEYDYRRYRLIRVFELKNDEYKFIFTKSMFSKNQYKNSKILIKRRRLYVKSWR